MPFSNSCSTEYLGSSIAIALTENINTKQTSSQFFMKIARFKQIDTKVTAGGSSAKGSE
jgi:hypothetical protein